MTSDRSHLGSNIAHKNAAVLGAALLGEQIKAHCYDIAAISERHAAWRSEVSVVRERSKPGENSVNYF